MDYYNNNQNETGTGGFQNDPFSSNTPFFPGDIDPLHNEEMPNGPKKRKPMSKKTKGTLKIVALCLVCALAGGLVANPLYSAVTGSGSTTIYTGNRTPTQVDTASVNTEEELTMAEIYAKYVNSCVGITVNTTVNIFGQTTTSAASGSGFVLTQDGYIVTNYHVIEEAVNNDSVDIEVSFANGDKYSATLVGGEQDNDIAVLKIDATGLQPVTLGDSDQLVVGESVYTIGNPLGELTYSLSDGLVSALDRLITTSGTNPVTNQKETITLNVLQTNCAINPGNSGGPLFDSYGNVVGVVNAKYTETSSGVSAEGLGFALPINDLKDIIEEIIEYGYVTGKPYLGIQVNVVDEQMQAYGIPAGAVVEYVADGSCAQKGGLQVNDIITAIDDTAVDSPSALTAALSSNYKAGDTITLTVVRNLEEIKLTITLDEENDQTESANQIQDQSNQQNNYQGSYSWPFGGFFW